MKDPKYNNLPLYNALRKYGYLNVEWEVLSSHETIEEANQAEINAIKSNPLNYNVASGGMTAPLATPEIRKKISDGLKGRIISKETRATLREYALKQFSTPESKAEHSRIMRETMARKEIVDKIQAARNRKNQAQYKILSENYKPGMTTMELHKLTGVSTWYITQKIHRIQWLQMVKVPSLFSEEHSEF
jgi:hypothetical protein